MTITDFQPSQKFINQNTNSMQTNTNLYKVRGRIMCLGGVSILCLPVTPAVSSFFVIGEKKEKVRKQLGDYL